jgi:GNAT superfamily N-acetyltransferase
MQKISLLENRKVLKEVFASYDKKDFTIDCVIEGTMCKVFSNCPNYPTVFLIKNGPFYILGGDYNHPDVEKLLEQIPQGATILPCPAKWVNTCKAYNKWTLEKYFRYELHHKNIEGSHLDKIIAEHVSQFEAQKIDLLLATKINIDRHFNYHLQNFESPDDFINRGIGYAIIYQDSIIAVASSALVCEKGIEINIMVLPEFRGNSLSKLLAAHILKAVVSENKIPHWDAANEISLNLAKRLGYEFINAYPVYRVIKA